MTFYNHNLDLINVNVYTKFGGGGGGDSFANITLAISSRFNSFHSLTRY